MNQAHAYSIAPLVLDVSTAIDHVEWNAYVANHNLGSFFHRAEWAAAVKNAYNYEPIYISARRAGVLAGVLPLSDIRAPLLGHSLVSSAFTVGGGPLADDAGVLAELLERASSLGKERNCKYIECRSDFDSEGWMEKSSTHATFRAPLIKDESQALTAIPRKRRAEVRKALAYVDAGDLVVDQNDDRDLFYALYAQSLRRLGTPIFSKRFLNAILNAFKQNTEISIARYRGEPVAALVSFYDRGTVLPYYVGATEAARKTRAFDFLYWSIMRRAVNLGCDNFDFGRSKIGSGAYEYKKLWGLDPQPVSYRIKLIGSETMPDINPTNPKFAVFTKLWPHLPLSVTNRLGPMLAPNFP